MLLDSHYRRYLPNDLLFPYDTFCIFHGNENTHSRFDYNRSVLGFITLIIDRFLRFVFPNPSNGKYKKIF